MTITELLVSAGEACISPGPTEPSALISTSSFGSHATNRVSPGHRAVAGPTAPSSVWSRPVGGAVLQQRRSFPSPTRVGVTACSTSGRFSGASSCCVKGQRAVSPTYWFHLSQNSVKDKDARGTFTRFSWVLFYQDGCRTPALLGPGCVWNLSCHTLSINKRINHWLQI